MKPIITLYSEGKAELTKKFDNFVHAAYWVGVESAEQDLESVKVRLSPLEEYDADVGDAKNFASLLVDRGINFSFEFFVEPMERGDGIHHFTPPTSPGGNPPNSNPPSNTPAARGAGSKATPEELRSALEKDLITQKEYKDLLSQIQ